MKQREAICSALLADLKSCSVRRDLYWGRRIHAKALETGNGSSMFVMRALMKMYTKCGSMPEARRQFSIIRNPQVSCWNALLLGYADNGEGHTALELFSKMKSEGFVPNGVSYVAAVKACASIVATEDDSGKAKCLDMGRSIHSEIGVHSDIFVQSTLVDMYAKCGSMADARQVFDSIEKPDVVAWTALLLGYADNGEGKIALKLFSEMKAGGCMPNALSYLAALKACICLAEDGNARQGLAVGAEIHSEICDFSSPHLHSTLIDMYAKCGSMVDARRVFNSIQKPKVVAWTALILGYAEKGEAHTALEMFAKMKAGGCAPDSVAFVAALKACTSLVANGDGSARAVGLKRGREVHMQIGSHLDRKLQNMLIDMYAKCGSMQDAHQVFDSIQIPDVVSWNGLLLGYADNGEENLSLDLFSKMKATGCAPDPITFVSVLKACGAIGALALGRKLHSDITEFTVQVVTCLVDFYAKCGSLEEARAVFDLHPKGRDIASWNALLAGYSSCGDTSSVFKLFEAMQDEGFRPDSVTFLCMHLCCSHAGLVMKARQYLEAMPVQYGVTPDVFNYNCMVDVLGRANQLFEAVSVLRKMPCNPNAVTWRSLLAGCRKWKNVEVGRIAFQSLVEIDKASSTYVLMASIYGSEEQERVLNSRTKHIQPEQAYVADELGRMVRFVVGEEDPPQVKEKQEQLLRGMQELGYVAADLEKDPLCGHCEKRAVVYGILHTPPGEPVRAFKNTNMCDGCHESTKMLSKLSGRTVMVRDASRFHVMVDGSCSCGDCF